MANRPLVPDPVTLAAALGRSEPLARLTARLADSRARYAAVLPYLPAALRDQVAPGVVDDEGWSLVADNAAVAAKLRHLCPRLEDALAASGWPAARVRVRVAGRG